MSTTLASTAKAGASTARLFASVFGIAAGLTWLAFGFESIVNKGQEDYRNIVFLLPWLLTMAFVYSLHRIQAPAGGWWERNSYLVLLGAMAVAVIGQPGIVWDIAWLKPVAFVGFLGFVAGTLVFGFTCLRAGFVPTWLAWALALTQLGTMAMGVALSPWVPLENEGSYSGAIVHGAVFLAAGLWLARSRSSRSAARDGASPVLATS